MRNLFSIRKMSSHTLGLLSRTNIKFSSILLPGSLLNFSFILHKLWAETRLHFTYKYLQSYMKIILHKFCLSHNCRIQSSWVFSHYKIRNSLPLVSLNMLFIFFPPLTRSAQRHFIKSIFLPRVSQKQSRHFLSCASKFFQPLSTVQFQNYAHILR